MGDKTNNEENLNEEIGFNAYAIPCNRQFVTSKELKKTPPSEEMLERRKFFSEHDFSSSVDKITGELKITTKEKDISNSLQ